MPSPIHRFENAYFVLSHVGEATYLAVCREGPKEKAPFVEYDLRRRKWRLIDPAKEDFSGDPSSVVIPVIEVKELSGEVGEEKKKIVNGHLFGKLPQILVCM